MAAQRDAVPIIYLNGKFTAQHTTGTQRVASCFVLALDRLMEQDQIGARIVLVCPTGGHPPVLKNVEVMYTGPCNTALSIWEQIWLPLIARRGLLVNLSGSAPLIKRRQFCMIHDAAVFDHPQAYTALFRNWYTLLFKVVARTASRLFTVSVFSRRQLIKHLGKHAERIEVLPNGSNHLDAVQVDPHALERFGLRPDGYWLAVGGANSNKNLAVLRQAFSRLSEQSPGSKLLIVGGLNAKVFGAEPAEAFSHSDSVVITGPVDDATLKAFYQSAIALVFPSLYEGFGLPPLEAMACACPVLASSAASIPEVCADAALYFDPHCVEGIATAMQRLLSEPGLRERLTVAGAQRAAEFDWQRSAARLLERMLS